jgi:AcrR family transcriptional regulator
MVHDTGVTDARRTDTRERILTTAAHLFGEKGFAETSIRDVAEALGVTKAALYYHFSSKDEIYQEIVSLPLAQLREVAMRPHDLTTPQGRAALVHQLLDTLAQCPPHVKALLRDTHTVQHMSGEATTSGLTQAIADAFAMGLSGVADVNDASPDHRLRAFAAVSAAQASLEAYHVIHPDCVSLEPEDLASIEAMVARVLEG